MITMSDKKIENNRQGSVNFGVIAVGQGGNNLGKMFGTRGINKIIYINTSQQDLAKLGVNEEQKLNIGSQDGAGKDPAISTADFEKNTSKINEYMKRIFDNNIEHILIVGSTGGGTGSGCIIPAIILSKKYLHSIGYDSEEQVKRVSVIATIPTNTESMDKKIRANSANTLKKLSENADNNNFASLYLVDNEKLGALAKKYSKGTMASKYGYINSVPSTLWTDLNKFSTLSSEWSSFDTADYRSLITCGGHIVIAEYKIKDCINTELNSSAILNELLNESGISKDYKLSTAKIAALIFRGATYLYNEKEGISDVIEGIYSDILTLTSGRISVHKGVYVDDDQTDTFTITLAIAGLEKPINRYKILETKG